MHTGTDIKDGKESDGSGDASDKAVEEAGGEVGEEGAGETTAVPKNQVQTGKDSTSRAQRRTGAAEAIWNNRSWAALAARPLGGPK